ncbi:uncharacterized protein LOC135199158 isoform X1 [Macrobrachium nipponense]|uniref:uncharacterized protein LOC135199158 isoform X1 n=1 Tax=Macrobrachium nipponense TaxID=159736 RepID=UPI0030C80CB3
MLPEEETEENLEEIRQELARKVQLPPTSELESLLNRTYYAQRRDINDKLPLHELQVKWPFLFKEVGMEVHFRNLLGMPMKGTLQKMISLRGPKFLKFFEEKYMSNKKIADALAELNTVRSVVDNDRPILATVLYVLCHILGEDPNYLFKNVTVVGEVSSLVLPATPCLIAIGTSVLQATRFMVAVDGRVINSDITSLVAAMAMVFASFYIFGIHYPSEASVTLEFIQRCFYKINPEKGTKKHKNKKESGSHTPEDFENPLRILHV